MSNFFKAGCVCCDFKNDNMEEKHQAQVSFVSSLLDSIKKHVSNL